MIECNYYFIITRVSHNSSCEIGSRIGYEDKLFIERGEGYAGIFANYQIDHQYTCFIQ